MTSNNPITITRQQHTPATVHIRQASPGDTQPSRTIEGYAILFNTPSAPLWQDDYETAREQIAPEAVTQALLDASDIKMTMNHNFSTLLARSKQGHGTLTYSIDKRGVHFSFEAPHTDDGDRALELVSRGDIDGCSFMFTCQYSDPNAVERTQNTNPDTGHTEILYTVRHIKAIHDFTLTPMPAYPDTEVNTRTLREMTSPATHKRGCSPAVGTQQVAQQVAQMRHKAATPLF